MYYYYYNNLKECDTYELLLMHLSVMHLSVMCYDVHKCDETKGYRMRAVF